MKESNMTSHAVMCSDVAGWSSSGLGLLFEFHTDLNPILSLFPPPLALLGVTTTPILPFEACYVTMHKDYFKSPKEYKPCLAIILYYSLNAVYI